MDKRSNIGSTTNIETLYRQVFVFILDVIEYSDLLKKQNKHTVALNLLQITTSWGELLNETRNNISYSDFSKNIEQSGLEAKRIKYWLNLCKYSQDYPNPENLVVDIKNLLNHISALSIISVQKIEKND